MGLVELEFDDQGIGTLSLNDPDRRNAMSLAMAEAFSHAINDVRKHVPARALIITGRGKAFAAGGDLQMLKAKAELEPSVNKGRMLDFYRSFLCIQDLAIPTIAAVNGHAIGAGLCLAAAADFRVISSTAKLGFTFTKLALHPGMGATLFLPRLIGFGPTTDLLVTGRIFDAQEAEKLRLTQNVCESDQVVGQSETIAKSILGTGPAAVSDLLSTLRPGSEDLNKALEREAEMQALGYARDEFIEGVTATIEKRSPLFSSG